MSNYTLVGGPNVAGSDGVVRAATQDQLNAGNVTLIQNAASEAANAQITANAAAALSAQAAALAPVLAPLLVELGFAQNT